MGKKKELYKVTIVNRWTFHTEAASEEEARKTANKMIDASRADIPEEDSFRMRTEIENIERVLLG